MNILELFSQDVRELVEGLVGSQVEKLNVTSSDFGNAYAVVLARGLPRLQQLIDLDLSLAHPPLRPAIEEGQIVITQSGAAALAESLPKSQLQFLDLSHHRPGRAGVVALAQALPDSKLLSLTLRGSGLSAACVEALAKALFDGAPLKRLSLPENSKRMSGRQGLAFSPGLRGGVKALMKALPESHLVSLDLSQTDIQCEDLVSVAEALPKSQLANLYLTSESLATNSSVCVEAFRTLAAAVPKSKLTQLEVNWENLLRVGGKKAFEDALSPQSRIKSLTFAPNSLEEMKTLAQILPHSQLINLVLLPSWRISQISYPMHKADGEVLSLGLQDSRTVLETLDLRYLPRSICGFEFLKPLLEGIAKCSLKSLTLSEIRWNVEIAELVADSISSSSLENVAFRWFPKRDTAEAKVLAKVCRSVRCTKWSKYQDW